MELALSRVLNSKAKVPRALGTIPKLGRCPSPFRLLPEPRDPEDFENYQYSFEQRNRLGLGLGLVVTTQL